MNLFTALKSFISAIDFDSLFSHAIKLNVSFDNPLPNNYNSKKCCGNRYLQNK